MSRRWFARPQPDRLSIALVLALAGCATAETTALRNARVQIEEVRADTRVSALAPVELAAAETALRRGQEALQDGAERADVDTLAYVAARRAQIAREVAAARADQVAIERSGEERERTLREAAERRARMLEQQLANLQAQRTDRGVIVTLGDVLFASGRSDLTPGGVLEVNRIADALRDAPETTAVIEGHTDSQGDASYNLSLSEARAETVRQALIAAGVAPERIVARGMGEAFPKAPNTTAAGRQQNRRVEIVIQEADQRQRG